MSSGGAQAADAMNAVAERYSHLVLAIGQHDPDYVDAFYGPAEWKTQAETNKQSLDEINAECVALNAKLEVTNAKGEVRNANRAKKSGSDMDCCAAGTADGDLIQLRRE